MNYNCSIASINNILKHVKLYLYKTLTGGKVRLDRTTNGQVFTYFHSVHRLGTSDKTRVTLNAKSRNWFQFNIIIIIGVRGYLDVRDVPVGGGGVGDVGSVGDMGYGCRWMCVRPEWGLATISSSSSSESEVKWMTVMMRYNGLGICLRVDIVRGI